MITRKEPGQEPGEAVKDEGLTRRTAIKRIAAGLAGAGIVVVAGILGQGQDRHIYEKGKYGDSASEPYGDSAPKHRDEMATPPYGDSAKLPYSDKAPN
jgi:hypothetical protein